MAEAASAAAAKPLPGVDACNCDPTATEEKPVLRAGSKWKRKVDELNDRIASVLESREEVSDVRVGSEPIFRNRPVVVFDFGRNGRRRTNRRDGKEEPIGVAMYFAVTFNDAGDDATANGLPEKSVCLEEEEEDHDNNNIPDEDLSLNKKPVKKKVVWRRDVDEMFGDDDDDESDDETRWKAEEEFPATGARSRRLDVKRFEEPTESIAPPPTASHPKTTTTTIAEDDDERRIVFNVTDSPRSRNVELKRRRRRGTGKRNDSRRRRESEWRDGGGATGRTRSLDIKDSRRQRRSGSNSTSGDDDDDEEEEEAVVGDHRHDNCFLPFNGYGECYDGPVGFLTSKLADGTSTADHDPIVAASQQKRRRQPLSSDHSQQPVREETAESGWKRAPPQMRNRIRRMRSGRRHATADDDDDKLWFGSSTTGWSFNSRCTNSRRFDTSQLDENSRRYYCYRSLPRISSSLVSASHQQPPGNTPPAKRAAAARRKIGEQMLL